MMGDEWDVVEKQFLNSKMFRFPYKQILGESLTDIVTKYHSEGLSVKECYSKILERLRYILTPEAFESVKSSVWIGVNSRYAEQNAYKNRMKKVI